MTSPYAPPKAVVSDLPAAGESAAEQIRREHILHEVRLKSIGALYYLGCLFLGLSGLAAIVAMASQPASGMVVILIMYLTFGAIFGALGYGFRRTRPWIKIPGAIVASLGLLAFPIGTLINAHILYLLFSRKGQTVLSAPYQEIIAATPHVKYRRSVGDWIAIGVLVAMLVGLVLLVALGTR